MNRTLPLTLALAALALAGCKKAAPAAGTPGAAQAAETGTPVETVSVAPSAFSETLEITGTFEAINDAILSAQGAGTLVSLVPLGTVVGAGQAVARLDPGLAQAGVANAQAGVRAAASGVERARSGVAQAEAGVRAAQASLEAVQAAASLAEDNYRRQERLYRDSIISALEFQQYRTQRAQTQAQVGQAQAGVAQAQAAVAQAQGAVSTAQAQLAQAQAGAQQAGTNLRNTLVVSPFAGRVEQHYASQGEQLTPGRQVARVVAAGRLKLAGDVAERYAGQIHVGDAVDVLVPGQPPTTGRVMFVAQAIDPATRTFRVEAEVGNNEGAFKPAMAGRMRVRLGGAEGVLVVPRNAIVRTAEGSAVYVVARTDSGTVAVRRPVKLGETNALEAVVAEGLSAGDVVIVSGQTQVDTGTKVVATPLRPTDTAEMSAPADSSSR